jgi:hypothetical protein
MVRLEPGSHRSPDEGVCVVELASMIAGEPFTDRPRCVDRVIGAFLRGWNDRAGYADRQRLYPYACRVVGTGGYGRVSRIRRDRCLSWSGANLDRGPIGRLAARLRMRARIAWSVGLWPAFRLREGAGAYAARQCFARGGSEEAFALLDDLLEVGPRSPEEELRLPPHWIPAELERLAAPNGNGNGNRHPRDELGIRATIIARRRGNPAADPSRRSERPLAEN